MKKVFISYSRRNLNIVERLARDLQDAGLEVWVDFRKIKGGEAWRQAIYNGIDESEFVIACLSAPAAESEWVRRELEIAQAQKKLIIPVMLERAFDVIEKYPETKVLLDVQIINFAELNYERAFPTLLSSLPGREQTADYDDIDPSLIPNPFKGLESFQETDNDFFFGREALIDKAVERLAQIVDKNEDARFMAFVGASGSGKSSVVRAGIVPAIRAGRLPGSDDYPIIIFKPGAKPVEAMASRLLPLIGDVSVEMMVERLSESHRALDEISRELMVAAPPEDRFTIIIDQFEEVFTRVDYEEQLQFLDLIYEAVTSKNGRALILITMRADFFDRLSHFPLLAALFGHNNLVIVADMSSDELRKTIEGPAIAVGLVYDHGLPDRILEEVLQQPGSLPLLQYALSQIFEQRDRRRLTWDAYNTIGGVRQALARHAENIYRKLNSAQQDLMQRLLLRLVEVGETGEATRRRVHRSELSFERVSENALNELLDMMTSSSVRLLVSSRELRSDPDEAKEEEKPIVSIEVVHEALIREWSRFQNWVHDDEENLRISTEILKTAQEWENAARDDSYLLTQSRLDRALVWVQTADASQLQRDFVNLSAESARKQAANERQQQVYVAELEEASRRRLRLLVAVLFIGIIISVAFLIRSIFSEQAANVARLQAEEGLAINRSIGLANEARLHPRGSDDPFLGVGYAVEASAGTIVPVQAQQTLADVVWQAGARRQLLGHDSYVWTVAYSPDGRYILSGAGETPSDSSLILWDASTGEELDRLEGHTDRVYTVTFSPDGTLAASGSQDSSVIIWDLASRSILHNLGAGDAAGHDLDVWSVKFTPDGRQLLSGDSSGRIIVWDVASGAIVHDYRDIHTAHVEDIDFSADGQMVLTGSDDNYVKFWNLETGEVVHEFLADSYVLSVRIMPDGDSAVSADYSGKVIFWDFLTEKRHRVITVENATPIRGGLVLADAGQTLIVGDDAGNIFFFDLNSDSERPFQEFRGHDAGVSRLALSPDESTLVSSSFDESLIIWDLQGRGAELSRHNLGQAVLSAVLSPDGSLIAASTEDGQVQVWTSNWENPRNFEANVGHIHQLAFSPDGTLLAAAGENGTVLIWNVADGSIAQQLTESLAPVRTLAFSPDGTLLAAAGGQVQVSTERPIDNSVRVWNLASGTVLYQLYEHTAAVRSLAFSPSGSQLLSASDDSSIVLWDMTTGAMLRHFDGHTDTVWALAFSPDGTQFLSGSSDTKIILWDLASGAVLRRLAGHNTAVRALAFSPDGQYALSGSGTVQTSSVGEEYRLRYWNIASGEMLREFPGHSAMINSVSFNATGNQALSAARDGNIIIWRIESLSELLARIAANYDVVCVPEATNSYCNVAIASADTESAVTTNHRFPIQATALPMYTEGSFCNLEHPTGDSVAPIMDTSAFAKTGPYRLGYSDSGQEGTSHAWILAWARFEADNQPEIESFLSRDAQGNPEQQLADIDTLLEAGIDILIIHPVETANMDALEAKLQSLVESGIAVVMVGFRSHAPVYTTYVGQDDYEVGCIMAQELVALSDGEGDIVRIHAVNEAPADIAFKAGASAVLMLYPNINIVNEAGVGFNQRLATDLVADNQTFTQLIGLLGFTGDLALGGEQGLLNTERPLAPVVSDHDLSLARFIVEQGIEGVQVRVTMQMGATAVQTALAILAGEPVSQFVRISPELLRPEDLAAIDFAAAPPSGYVGDYADLPARYWPND